MDIIIARFRDANAAAAAVQALRDIGFTTAQETTGAGAAADFEVSAAPATSPGAADTPGTATTGAVAGGVAGGVAGVVAAAIASPFIGPGAILAGIGVGAYTGSLIGALSGTHHHPDDGRPLEREDEIVKVAVNGAAGRSQAMDVLTAHQAVDIREERG